MPKKVRESFAFTPKGEDIPVVLIQDDTVTYADDHPYVKMWPDRFKDANDGATFIEAPAKRGKVEQATAAPGEERNA
jgi:hypothetical protein